MLEVAGGAFYQMGTGLPYNPASSLFPGFNYTLTAPDGTAYDYSATAGLQQMVGPKGQRLVWSSSGIEAANGDHVAFQHDDAGRLTLITAPDGTQVSYSYNAAGNLQTVSNPAADTHTRYAYQDPHAHFLTSILAPTGQTSEAISYDAAWATWPPSAPSTSSWAPHASSLARPSPTPSPRGRPSCTRSR